MTNKVSDDYEHLYHYTDFKGLCGILDSQCLWATHFKFLNDESELQLFQKKLPSFLEPIVRNVIDAHDQFKESIASQDLDIEQLIKKETHSIIEAFDKLHGETKPIYITSFSRASKENKANQNEDGLLSQWRSYGQDGGFLIKQVYKISWSKNVKSTP